MISLRACCCSDHLVKLCRKRGASVTLSRWRRTTDSNVGRQGSEACRQDRGPRTDSGRFQRAGSAHSSGPIRHVAVKATSAPSDLQARPLLRHERIDLPPEPGIQEVFRHLANDANRTRVVAAEIRAAFMEGRKVLVLTERTGTPNTLEMLLAAVGARRIYTHCVGCIDLRRLGQDDVCLEVD